MIPYAALRSPVKRWVATLTLDGEELPLAGDLPRRSLGFGQARGTCSLETKDFPGATAGAPATVTLTLNGAYSTTFFTGKLDARPISDLPLRYEIGLVDSLARLDRPLGEDILWHDRGFTDGVRDLLHAAGFEDSEIGDLYNPGNDFKLGPVDAIKLPASETVIQSALDELMTFGGCGLFVLPDGTLSVIDAPGWPADIDDSTPVYAYGADLDEMGFFTARRTVVGAEGVVAKFTAKGNRLSTKKIADATFTLNGVIGKHVTETYPLLQTDACAKKIAEREIVRRNRDATEVDVTAPLNPNLRPGDTILFRHAELGFPTNTPAIIIGVSTSGDEMTMNISVGARRPAGDVSTIPPPKPSFTLSYEVQPVKLASVMAVNTVVEAKDTSSDPSGFGITSRAWTAVCDGATQPEPATVEWSYDEAKSDKENPVPNPIFVFPTLEGAKIALAIESKSGEGATTIQAVSPPPGTTFTRTISVASGATGWRVLAGSFGWREYMREGSCTAVPTINDTGPLLAGFSDGAIYKTDDYLATEPILLSTLDASVTCLWVNEGNPQEVLAGAGDKLYCSNNGGLAFTPIATFADAVNYCESSPATASEIRVCAGNKLYITGDGATFTELLAGPEGSLCRKVGSAPWGHLAVFSGTSDIATAWKFEEGHTIDWSQVPVEHMPVDLAAVTPLQYEEGYLVADGGASDLIRDGLFGQLGYLANLGNTQLYKLMPGPSAGTFVATYCATTQDGGPHKVVMAGGKAFPIDVGDALRIGYGQATDPARPPELIVLPNGESGTADRLMHYLPETATWEWVDLPVAGQAWIGVDTNPTRPTEWLIWTAKRAFWTGSAGRTWAEIYLPPTSDFYMIDNGIYGLCFTGMGSDWLMSFWRFGYQYGTASCLVRGQAAQHLQTHVAGWSSAQWPASGSGPAQQVSSLVRGYDGEIWGAGTAAGDGGREGPWVRSVWVDASALSITDVGQTIYAPATVTPGASPTTARAGYAVWNANIARTTNYRSAVPDEGSALAAGGSVAACLNGVFAGSRQGIAEIRTGVNGIEVAVIAASGVSVGRIVAGSRRRGAGAIAYPTNTTPQIFAHNGMQWAMTQLPDGAGAICDRIAVVEP